MNVLYFYLLLLVHPYISMWWKSFNLTEHKSWEALIPGYNYFVVFKLGTKKPWWSLLLLFPGVHIVMWSVANVSYIRRFGYFTLIDTVQGIFFPYIIMYKIAQSNDPILPETNWANSKEVGDREWGDHLALFLALPFIGHVIALGFAAVTRAQPGKKTKVKEWGDSIWFALVAALIIRTYVFEPFKIPTGSMEKTLLVGDFLFVNKLAYGPKVPVTPVSYPLVHNTVPWINIKSYSNIETSNYTRLPGFGSIERNDVVVFNYPAGDTAVYDPRMPNGLMGHNYHDIVNQEAMYLWKEQTPYYKKAESIIRQQIQKENQLVNANDFSKMVWEATWENAGEKFFKEIDLWKSKARQVIADGITHRCNEFGILYETIEHYGVIYRPVDKRENYIKRCVGTPGDWLELKESILYVNDKRAYIAPQQNLLYEIQDFKALTDPEMMAKYTVDANTQYDQARDQYGQRVGPIQGVHVNRKAIKRLKKDFTNQKFNLRQRPQYSDNPSLIPTPYEYMNNIKFFPNDPFINNTVTDFHKFQIPKKGQQIKINPKNIAYYRRIITAYEGHNLVEKEDGTILIDGKKATNYTFAMNYYWMMGDNRFNSADSRMWGFVPEDHIVGKASMVWFSNDPYGGFRWDRMFTAIK